MAYILDNRMKFYRKLPGQLEVFGEGLMTHYIFFHRWPNQCELADMFAPVRTQRMFVW